MSDGFARIKAIVIAAGELAGSEREVYLTEACGGDAALRAEVEALLAHASDTPSILATGAAARELTPELLEELQTDTAGRLPGPIGPYTPRAVLGEGGMGTVYRAEQTTPIHRDVALKLIRRGLDTDRIVARFEAERQVLALMDHPYIARVLDAGASGDGRPYFVMELVDGVAITTFCDGRSLGLQQRLALFLAVCQGVQHAHQRGIIHRDLKPSNILVQRHDGVASPKIIDFGVAKAMTEPQDGALLTQAGHCVGTPEYMSPEQAGVFEGGVDTRTDVYSLGVLLYELVTGWRPFDLWMTDAALQQALAEMEPPRPSVRAKRWKKLLAGDLDNIILKALAKASADRYSSVEQFTDDIRRHLDGLPVRARPATWPYRVRKFVRRHRVGAGVAAAAVLVLIGFAATMAVQSARLAAERDRAVAAEHRARTEAETATQVAAFLVDLFEVSDPSEARGNTVTAREILDRGAARIGRELEDKPETQAFLMDAIGRVYQGLGLFAAARPLLEDALRIRRELWGEDHVQVAESVENVANLSWDASPQVSVEPMFRQALATKQKWLGPQHPSVAATMNRLASVLHVKSEGEAAETLSREALAIRRAAFGDEHADVAESLNNLAGILHHRGKLDEAESTYRQALALDRRLHGGDSPVVAIELGNLANVLTSKADFGGAEAALVEALAIARKIYGDSHPTVPRTMYALGRVQMSTGRLADAEAQLRESLALHRKQVGNENLWVATTLGTLGQVIRRNGDARGAERNFREALAIHEAVQGDTHSLYAALLLELGSVRQQDTAYAEAESLYRRALALDRRLRGQSHINVSHALHSLAGVLLLTGDLAGAEAAHREALEIRRRMLPTPHPRIADSLVGLGRVLVRRGNREAAVPLVREGVEMWQGLVGAGDPRIAELERLLKEVLSGS